MSLYVANLKYSRVWSVEIEADSLETAQESAQAWANSEDNQLDINEREWVSLVGIEEAEQECDECGAIHDEENKVMTIKEEGANA